METETQVRATDFTRKTYLGIRRGVAKALAEHKRLGQSVVVSRDGQIVWIPPEEIMVPTDGEIEADYEALFGKDSVSCNGDPSL
jgi:hypothetical protein